jgi:hypothetical protein
MVASPSKIRVIYGHLISGGRSIITHGKMAWCPLMFPSF